MSKIIEIDFSNKKPYADTVTRMKETEPKYTIIINPEEAEFVNAAFNNAGGYWMVYINCKSIDDIPRMRNEAMKQLKIRKAINQG